MALSVTSNFTGTAAMKFITPALLKAYTLDKQNIEIYTNIKYKFNLSLADNDNIIQTDGCSFNAQGTVTLTEKVLTPIALKVNYEFCKTTLKQHWISQDMTAGALNTNAPKAFVDFLTARAQEYVAQGIEKLIWQGKVSGSTGIYVTFPYLKAYDGFYTLTKASASTVKVTGTTVTASNVLAELEKVYVAIPDVVFDKPDLKIFVTRAILRSYMQAVPATYSANANFDITKPQSVFYKGTELQIADLPANSMIAGIKSNFHFGTDLISDNLEYRLIDMSETDGSDNIRMIMKFTSDVEITNDAEIVVYG